MRKFYTLLSGMLFILLFSTCKQFTEDIDVYLSYWASEAFVKSATIEAAHPHDKDGIASVASDKDVEITLRLQNPHKFQLQMPSTSKKKIVQFHHLSDMQPAVQTDFEMIQTTADTLQLIYKRDFLQRAEWGEKDLSSVITLYARDGRPFKQEYTVKIKANTPPPQITHYSVAKTKGTPAYYVLCLIVPDMDKKIPAGLLHKDIAQITVNGTHYALSVSEAQNAFVTPEGSPFIGYTDTEKLAEPDADEVPRSSAAEWVLYYKTDVEVKEGVRKKDYTVQLADAKALVTPVLQATTRPNKPEAVVVRISKGEKVDAVSGDGSSSANARVIKAGAGAPEAELTLRTPTSEALVYAAVTETRSGASTKYEGNTVKIPLALNGANEKTFKLAYYAGGAGFVPTLIKTVYYKITQSYTVRFDAQGGAPVPALQAVLYGKNARSPSETVVKTGYTFGGWYKDSAYTGAAWNFATDTVTGNTTLYAKWNSRNDTAYTVKHLQQDITGSGYTEVVADRQTLHGTTGTNAAVPLKTYTGFEAGTYTPATIAADGSTVVEVKYNRKVYTVTFNAKGGTPVPADQSVRYEGKGTVPTQPHKTGYDFGGWYKDSAYTGAAWNFATDTVSGNTTLYAKWTANGNTPYIVKHLKQDVTSSGYTEVVADSQTLHGTTGTNAAVPLKTYTGFEAGTYTPATIAADGSTVVAVKYNRKVYTVSFNANGGTPAPSNKNVRYEEKVTAPSATPSKQGYTFGGWYKDSAYTGAAWNFATDTVTGNTNLHAKWTANGNTPYIVKHLKQDVTGSGYTEVVADSQTLHGTTGTNAAVPLKTYTGFEAGTYTPATIAADGSTVIEVKYNRKVYTITFNANGGSPAPSTQFVRYEGTASTPSISKTGYTFGGWYKEAAFTTQWNFTTDTVTGNTALYAKWTANTYKVRFNSNGGSGSMNDQPFTYGEASKPLRQNTFTKTNHRFTGWATSSGSSTVVHTDQQSVNNLTTTNGGVVNLYAVWVPLPKVTFKVEGGKGGKLKCTYDGTTKETSSSTGEFFIVEYLNISKVVAFTAVPDSGWALAGWNLYPGPFNDGSLETDLERAVTNIGSDVTVKVKFYQTEISAGPYAWRDLKQAVKDAPAGKTIKINGIIQASSATGNNGEIEVTKNLSIKPTGSTATLDANNMSRIFKVTGGKFQLSSYMVLQNGNAGENVGGGIYVSGGELVLLETTIKDCTAKDGGGIYLTGNGTKGSMYNTKILNNKAQKTGETTKGGGICIADSASFEMDGGSTLDSKIDGNVSTGGTSSSSYGGGVCVIGNGDTGGTHASFIFKKGTISNNTARYGGGVMVEDGGTFTMEGMGESYTDYNKNIIKDNTADASGGGVAVHGAMTMNGGSIKNNKAKDGGCGIFLWHSQPGQTTLTMTNGFITSNDVAPGGLENKGKGVFVRYTGLTMKMSGYARIVSTDDVYLTDGAKITVDSASFTPPSNNAATITPKYYNAGTQVLTGNYVGTHNGKFKVTPNAGTNWSVGSNGYLKTP